MGVSYPAGIWQFVDELLDDREGTPFSAALDRKYTRKFLVMVRDKTMSSVIACQAPGVPRPFSFYESGNGVEYDSLSLCTELSAKQDGQDYCRWVVTAQYNTVIPGRNGGLNGAGGRVGNPNEKKGAGNNPEEEPPELEWDFEVTHKAPACDLAGKPFTSSAGQAFSPAPTLDAAYPVLVLSRNELGFDRKKAASYAFALNDKPFLGASRLHAQCLPPKAKAVFKGPVAYWRVTYRIRFKPEAEGPDDADGKNGWQPRFLDQGTKVLETRADGTRKAVLITDGGVVAHHPVLLDGFGNLAKTQIDLAVGPKAVADAQAQVQIPIPAYRDFKGYRVRSFKDLLADGLS